MNRQHAIWGKIYASGAGQARGPHPIPSPPLAPTSPPIDAKGIKNVGPEGRGKGMGGGDAGALRLPCLNAAFVEIRNLKKSYGLKPVLRGVDLGLRQGERMALLGANGAGKTTLLRILAGLTKPDAGTVTVVGLDCVRDAQQIRRLVGFVGHQPYLYEELTALENLLFFGRMYTVQHARERALELLQRVGLEKRAQERVSTLSRGQVQRLAWARALLHSPHLLLLDEPDTGLDQDGNELIDALLSEHSAQGGSIVFTTHQLERALQLSDQIVVLGNRRVAYQGETKSLNMAELQQACREAGR
ncbi:MAG TPA: heme ABC exporter ATP-binding protein CcmA [Ktedonobacteraceae bacterium]|nr:heme ABC exporter ATP-binding protein CcmA [Ktedonobacteraceae bacterium]